MAFCDELHSRPHTSSVLPGGSDLNSTRPTTRGRVESKCNGAFSLANVCQGYSPHALRRAYACGCHVLSHSPQHNDWLPVWAELRLTPLTSPVPLVDLSVKYVGSSAKPRRHHKAAVPAAVVDVVGGPV